MPCLGRPMLMGGDEKRDGRLIKGGYSLWVWVELREEERERERGGTS